MEPHYEGKVLKADITVIQKPVEIELDCPHCDEEIKIDYPEFAEILGEPCDWRYSKIYCPICGREIEIDDVDWD